MDKSLKNRQYYKFCMYGFLKNLRFFDAFFILFLVEKGLTFTQIGVLYAVREVAINLFEIPSGIIADTFGRRNSLAGSLLAYIISFLVFYIAGSFWFFLMAFILYGIGDAFRTGTHKGMIMQFLKMNNWQDRKIEYYGHTRSWSQMGSALSSLIAGFIVFYTGNYTAIFLFSIIPYIINFLLILSYPGELNVFEKSNDQNSKNGIGQTFKSFFNTIREIRVLRIINNSALHSAYTKAIKDYIQPIMVRAVMLFPFLADVETEKKNGIFIGILYFFIYLLTSRASATASMLVKKGTWNIALITLLTGFFSGFLCGVFSFYELKVLAILAFIGIYIVENIRKPIMTGYIADSVDTNILTSVISAESQLKTVITVIISVLFGILADSFGIGISIAVISILLFLLSTVLNILSGKKGSQISKIG